MPTSGVCNTATVDRDAIAIRLLGPLELRLQGRVVEIGSPKQRAVLALLAARLNRVVSLHALIDEVWPHDAPPSATVSVRSLVSRLRRVLDADHPADSPFELTARDPGYVLAGDPDRIDVHRFRRLLTAAADAERTGNPALVAELLSEAVGLWRATDGLADLPGLGSVAASLEEDRLDATERLADAELARGRPSAALTLIEAHVAAHPLRERAWGQRMVALYRLGRQAEALRTYQELYALLDRELGLVPTPPLRELERRILNQDPDLDGAIDPGPAPATGRGVGPDEAVVPALPLLGRGVRGSTTGRAAFVGRAGEMDELERLLAATRLLTLTGVGGVGKTRLALQLAGRVADRFSDGVRVVELAPVDDPTAVPVVAMRALGMRTEELDAATPEIEARAQLGAHLRSARVLLVLDNCEHLIGAVSVLTRAVLAAAPAVTILLTSRENLGLPEETVWPVPGLSLPPPSATDAGELAGSDAVALFCERAAAVRAGFECTDTNARALTSICRRLDGIPLALELAAARLRILSADQVASSLEAGDPGSGADSGTAADGGPLAGGSISERHETLTAVLDWSYRLLPPPEQAVFARLAVFPADFDREAAEAVAHGDDTVRAGFRVPDLLARLVDKSLVVARRGPGTVRFRLLETVRAYAAVRLDASGETALRARRHRDFYLQLATERGYSPWCSSGGWLRRVSGEDDNYRAAVEWSFLVGESEAVIRLVGALGPYLTLAGHGLELQVWADRALAETSGQRSVARVSALIVLAYVLIQKGDQTGRPEALLNEALDDARAIGDEAGAATATLHLVNAPLQGGDLDTAEQLVRAGMAGLVAAGETRGLPYCEIALGWIALCRLDNVTAENHFRAGVEAAQRMGYPDAAVHGLSYWAAVAAARGDAVHATLLADEAVETARSLGLRLALVMALVCRAEAALLLDDLDAAAAAVREALVLLRDFGSFAWVAGTLEIAALVVDRRGDATGAALLLDLTRRVDAHCGQTSDGRPLAQLLSQRRSRVSAAEPRPPPDSAPPAGRLDSLVDLGPREIVVTALAQLGGVELGGPDRRPDTAGMRPRFAALGEFLSN